MLLRILKEQRLKSHWSFKYIKQYHLALGYKDKPQLYNDSVEQTSIINTPATPMEKKEVKELADRLKT
jgi:hypothetical protein